MGCASDELLIEETCGVIDVVKISRTESHLGKFLANAQLSSEDTSSFLTCLARRSYTTRYPSEFASKAGAALAYLGNFLPPLFVKVLPLLLDAVRFGGVGGETYDGVFGY
jgi:hypothetical protein